MADLKALLAMGFPENRAKRALAKSGHKGPQVAMDWIFAHENDADIDDPFEEAAGHTLGSATAGAAAAEGMDTAEEAVGVCATGGGLALSLVCQECGKQLKSEQAATSHASRTGHQNFVESTEAVKPLTPEEKAAKLKLLEEELKKRRSAREEEERKDAKKKEKVRRQTGKEIAEAKRLFKEKEMRRMVEERRREKEAERQRKEKIRAQIAKDKAARSGKRKATEGAEPAQATSAPRTAEATEESLRRTLPGQTRIQIRLEDGTALKTKFEGSDTLETLFEFVSANSPSAGEFRLRTTFPRKAYSRADDAAHTLKEAGLTPTAILLVTKA